MDATGEEQNVNEDPLIGHFPSGDRGLRILGSGAL